jgi:beta-lactamase class C
LHGAAGDSSPHTSIPITTPDADRRRPAGPPARAGRRGRPDHRRRGIADLRHRRVLAVARGGDILARVVRGTDARGTPLVADTVVPLASASKLVPGIAILRLADAGRLALDDPLAAHVPDAAAAQPGVTLRTPLSHIGGLPLEFRPGQVEYGPSLDWTELARACRDTPLAHEPSTSVQYSNVGYGLLGLVIERATALDYRTPVARLVVEPLGAELYVGRPAPPPPHAMVMGVDSPFVGTELEPFNSAFSRKLTTPWSTAYATADTLLALVRAYAGARPDPSRDGRAAEARSGQTHGLGGGFATSDAFVGFNGSRSITWPRCPWGLTVEVRGEKRPHWTPAAASPASLGQIAASGCLAWCDPVADVSWAVLGARTTDSGWMLRYAGAVGTAASALAAEAS